MHLTFCTFTEYFHICGNNCPSPQSLGNNMKVISTTILQNMKQKPWRARLFSHCHTMRHLWHLAFRPPDSKSYSLKHPFIQEIHGLVSHAISLQLCTSFYPLAATPMRGDSIQDTQYPVLCPGTNQEGPFLKNKQPRETASMKQP